MNFRKIDMAQKFKELLNGPATRQGKDGGGSGLGKMDSYDTCVI